MQNAQRDAPRLFSYIPTPEEEKSETHPGPGKPKNPSFSCGFHAFRADSKNRAPETAEKYRENKDKLKSGKTGRT